MLRRADGAEYAQPGRPDAGTGGRQDRRRPRLPVHPPRQQGRHAVQPLQPAPLDRGHFRARAPRLRGSKRPRGVRLLRAQPDAGASDQGEPQEAPPPETAQAADQDERAVTGLLRRSLQAQAALDRRERAAPDQRPGASPRPLPHPRQAERLAEGAGQRPRGARAPPPLSKSAYVAHSGTRTDQQRVGGGTATICHMGELLDHVRSYYEALNTGDPDKVAEHFTDDA